MKKYVLFAAVLIVACLVAGKSSAQQITRADPGEGQPEFTITAEGHHLDRCPLASNKLTIYFPAGYYLDLNVSLPSWEAGRITGSIPSLDSAGLTADQKEYLLNNIVTGELKIVGAGSRADCARGVRFKYMPPPPNFWAWGGFENRRGQPFYIYGKGFGDSQGKVVYPKTGGEGELTIDAWTNDTISARIPLDMPLGDNSVWVKRLNNDGTYTSSNVKEIEVLPVEVRTVPSKLMTSPRYSPYPTPRIPPPR